MIDSVPVFTKGTFQENWKGAIWDDRMDNVLRIIYPEKGLAGCRRFFPDLSDSSISRRVLRIGLRKGKIISTPKSPKKKMVSDKELLMTYAEIKEKVLDLLSDGASLPQSDIARKIGYKSDSQICTVARVLSEMVNKDKTVIRDYAKTERLNVRYVFRIPKRHALDEFYAPEPKLKGKLAVEYIADKELLSSDYSDTTEWSPNGTGLSCNAVMTGMQSSFSMYGSQGL